MRSRLVGAVILAMGIILGVEGTAEARVVCHTVKVTHTRQPKDSHRIVGTLGGAAVGGLVGNQFGGGNANKAFTALGVVGGGYAGNQIQKNMQRGNTYTTTERRCRKVNP